MKKNTISILFCALSLFASITSADDVLQKNAATLNVAAARLDDRFLESIKVEVHIYNKIPKCLAELKGRAEVKITPNKPENKIVVPAGKDLYLGVYYDSRVLGSKLLKGDLYFWFSPRDGQEYLLEYDEFYTPYEGFSVSLYSLQENGEKNKIDYEKWDWSVTRC